MLKPWKQLLQLPPSRGGLGLAAFSEEGGLRVADFGLYVMATPPRFSMDTKNVALENVALFKYDVILGYQFAKSQGGMYLKVRFWQVEVLELWPFEKNQESLKKRLQNVDGSKTSLFL